MKTKPVVKTFWEERVVRNLRGVTVSFYRRYDGSNLTMDFKVNKRRVRLLTACATVKDAEVVAQKEIQRLQEMANGLTVVKSALAQQRRGMGRVRDILAVVDAMVVKEWHPRTLQRYRACFLRLARVACPHAPFEARLDEVLTAKTVNRYFATRQKLPAVNRVDRLPVNGACNSLVRNARSLFARAIVRQYFTGVNLPDLTEFLEVPYLKALKGGFEPWSDAMYAAMHAESERLKGEPERHELWLVNAMLRRLGLRNEELKGARRSWIHVELEHAADGMGPPVRRAWLEIKDRDATATEPEFRLIKHGAPRNLELDAELQEILLEREGYLIANEARNEIDEFGEDGAYRLIYREHSKWLRPLLPRGGEGQAKTNHQLRMYAGSKIYTAHGLAAAAYFLGHRSVRTTEAWYARWLDRAPMLTGAAVSQARSLRRAA